MTNAYREIITNEYTTIELMDRLKGDLNTLSYPGTWTNSGKAYGSPQKLDR